MQVASVTLALGVLGAVLVAVALLRLWQWTRFHLLRLARRWVGGTGKDTEHADAQRPISRPYAKGRYNE